MIKQPEALEAQYTKLSLEQLHNMRKFICEHYSKDDKQEHLDLIDKVILEKEQG